MGNWLLFFASNVGICDRWLLSDGVDSFITTDTSRYPPSGCQPAGDLDAYRYSRLLSQGHSMVFSLQRISVIERLFVISGFGHI